jgi:hypothetical protein
MALYVAITFKLVANEDALYSAYYKPELISKRIGSEAA